MNKSIQKMALLAASIILFSANHILAQTNNTTSKGNVGTVTNPNAAADIQVVSNHVNALISGDSTTAKSYLASGYKTYGPGPADSANTEQMMQGWQENYKTQMNRSVKFVSESFKVPSGPYAGEWVSLWGDYNYTENSKNISFPFQLTAHVTNGKIDSDRIYYDRSAIMQALGYTFTPPATK